MAAQTRNKPSGHFLGALNARPKVTVGKGSVVFSVSADQTKYWNMDVSFRYTPQRDWIDFECRMLPHLAVKNFERFVASYVIEDMESTWVSAAMPTGEVFKKLVDRRTLGLPFVITRDAKAKAYLSDGRWKVTGAEAGRELWQDYHFKRPILVAMKESTGLAAVTMVDPKFCSLLAGQHQKEETAHDFTFSDNLTPGQPIVCRARVVIRPIGKFPDGFETKPSVLQSLGQVSAICCGAASRSPALSKNKSPVLTYEQYAPQTTRTFPHVCLDLRLFATNFMNNPGYTIQLAREYGTYPLNLGEYDRDMSDR